MASATRSSRAFDKLPPLIGNTLLVSSRGATGLRLRRLLVFIVAADEIHDRLLVAPLGRAVEDHQGPDQLLGAAPIAGIGMEDVAGSVLVEGAEAGKLIVRVGGV